MNSLQISSKIFFVFLITVHLVPSGALKFKYHSNEELGKVLKNFTDTTKNINTKLYQIGESNNKNPLWVMQLSAADEQKIGVPNIKYVANIHGNEAVGRELLLHFMEYLRDNYEKNSMVKCLLDNSRIHLLPSMNPDGFAASNYGSCGGEIGRGNEKTSSEYDLNRNFPDFFHENSHPVQLETQAVKKWMDEVPFVLSASLHGGAMVANYPFDTVKMIKTSSRRSPSKTPDNDVFEHLATVYASNHPKMKAGLCENNTRMVPNFKNGITNGAAWYEFSGGMQDYNYFSKGCMEITLEISCCKYPRTSELRELWKQNEKSLLMYSLEALKGISGQVFDITSRKPISNAKLQILGRNMTFRSTKNGEFWRILLPGKYQIKVEAPGYFVHIEDFNVSPVDETCPHPTTLNIFLTNSSFSTTPEPLSNPIAFPLRSRMAKHAFSEGNEISTEAIPVTTLSLEQEKPENFTEEELAFLHQVFRNIEVQYSKITQKDVRKALETEFQVSKEDIEKNFNDILKDFDEKPGTEKLGVFVKIFDTLIGKPVKETDKKWLEAYIKEEFMNFDSKKIEKEIEGYDQQNIFEKIMTILKLNEELELKNSADSMEISLSLILSTLLLILAHD